jgi:hypothetical protein
VVFPLTAIICPPDLQLVMKGYQQAAIRNKQIFYI